MPTQIDLTSVDGLASTAICTVITGDPLADNMFGRPPKILPAVTEITVGQHFTYEMPAHSLSVIRIKTA